MKTAQPIHFFDFPNDDNLYWIRWFDTIHPMVHGTNSPGVFVQISPISPLEIEGLKSTGEFKRYQKDSPISVVTIQATSIPFLSIGTLFKNKKAVGHLPLSSITINCDTNNDPQIICKKKDEAKIIPSWWRGKDLYRWLNRFEFSIETWNESWLCVIKSLGKYYLIPCPEVFRFFYAWNVSMAHIFFSGPWNLNYSKALFFDPENKRGTGVTEDGIWRLAAQTKFTLDDCKRLAPLYFDKTGYRRANEIFRNFQIRPNTNGLAALKAKIPFRDGPISLHANGLWLQKDKFLVLQLTGFRWPYTEMPKIYTEIANSNSQGKTVVPIINQKPFSTSEKVTSEKKEPSEITSQRDPQFWPETKYYFISSPLIEHVETERPQKDLSYKYLDPLSLKDFSEEASASSSGFPNYSNTGVGRAEVETLDPRQVSRFKMLLDALQELAKVSKIDEFTVIPPPDHSIRGKLPTWPVPKTPKGVLGKPIYTPWCFVKYQHANHLRTALVIQIRIRGEKVYLLELSIRANASYKLLIFKIFDHDDINNTVNYILENAVKHEGQWDKGLKDLSIFLKNHTTWKHFYNKNKNIALNKESLYSRIMRIIELF